MENIIFALDIGTTKVCAVVGELKNNQLRIIGMGTAPAQGMRKGMINDVNQAALAIAQAVEKAEETSGYNLSRAVVSMGGEHILSTNNQGAVATSRQDQGITTSDIERALDAAQAIALPQNRRIVHLVPRRFRVDQQDHIQNPLGLHGFRLEVEAHIITAATPALLNLAKCTESINLYTEEFVLNALASGEAVLEPTEKEMGVLVADIGGGTTDIALYANGMVWHTAVIPIGGNHITNDIAIGLRVPFEMAEQVKMRYGDCRPDEIDPESIFTVEPFGGEKIQVGRQDLAYVIEARVEEIFQLVLQDVKRSGYDGLLPAGIVLTGGTAQLRGIASVAKQVLGVPARIASPKEQTGLVQALRNPAYATSLGLLHWMVSGHNQYRPRARQGEWGRRLSEIFRALLPG
ncbi:MAG TPA: cell division protein FtsA [Anaerolineae bacterium]|nr:cell division protein FtsA [Anaerolineae bacterium]